MKRLLASLILATSIPGISQERSFTGSSSHPWETTLYATTGPAIAHRIGGYHRTLDFYSAGISVGKVFYSGGRENRIKGQFEYLVELEPFWIGRFPGKITYYQQDNGSIGSLGIAASAVHGATVAPLLFRYRAINRSRFAPYIQAGSGLLFTASDFPDRDSSRVNFTPQVDLGVHIATGKKQALVLGADVKHISNAGLGDVNRGVNISVLLRAGYTWWH